MISARILQPEIKALFEKTLLEKLNESREFQSARVISSPGAVGDIVQEVVSEVLEDCFPKELIGNFSKSFARRAMADVAFNDVDDNYFLVDIKTHNKSTNFNMPNLTSVDRLARFYEDDKNFFIVLLIVYNVVDGKLVFIDVNFNPIEFLDWNCLTIGALGWGQIQIANSNNVVINKATRKEWMLKLCEVLDIFYPKEIEKIKGRLDKFAKVRKFWLNKE